MGLLIEFIEQEPHIYDKSNPKFKDELLKQKTYENIGGILNLSGKRIQYIILNLCLIFINVLEEKVRKIWKNLRDRYVREKKKVTKSGQECEDAYSWPYMMQMKFLDAYIKPRSTYTATKATSSFILSVDSSRKYIYNKHITR